MAKLRDGILFIQFCLTAFFVQSSHLSDWPLPTTLQIRRYKSLHNRITRLNDNAVIGGMDSAVQPQTLYSFLVACLWPSVHTPSSTNSDYSPRDSLLDSPQDSERHHKICEICFKRAPVSGFWTCCLNGHQIHFDCFKIILGSSNSAMRKC